MRRFLASPRRRRRLLWSAGCLFVLAVTAIGIAAVPTGKPLPPVATPPAEPLESAPERREVRLTPAMRRGINETLDRFIPAAVGRRNPIVAWELAGPALRVGSTRRDWRDGDLPVHPFPLQKNASLHSWRPIYTYRDRVGLDLFIQPRRGAQVGAIAFSIEVVRRDRRWLVNSVYPAAVWSAPDERPFVTGDQDFTAGGTTAKAVYNAPKISQSTLSAAWLAIPLGVLSSVVLLPLVFILAGVRRNRRAVAAYKASIERRREP